MPGFFDSQPFLSAAAGVVLAATSSFYPTWQTFTTEDGLPDSSIRAIRVTDDGVWVGTDGGLALREDGTWRSWSAADGLPDAPVTAIDVDARTGDTWLGTWGRGLVRFTGGRFDRFTQFNSGLAGDLILDIVVDDGIVWTATNEGISSFKPTTGSWGLYLEARVDVPPDAATALCGTPSGLYAGSWCGPLLRFGPAQDAWVTVLDSVPGVRPGSRVGFPAGNGALAFSEEGRALWWTARGRLARRANGGDWQHLAGGAPGGDGTFVNCIAAKSEREVWLGTSAGLHALTDWETECYRTTGCVVWHSRVTTSGSAHLWDSRADRGVPAGVGRERAIPKPSCPTSPSRPPGAGRHGSGCSPWPANRSGSPAQTRRGRRIPSIEWRSDGP